MENMPSISAAARASQLFSIWAYGLSKLDRPDGRMSAPCSHHFAGSPTGLFVKLGWGQPSP